MGRPKARLPWRGQTLIEHTVTTLKSCVARIVVVRSEELTLPALDAEVIVDSKPEAGPLLGLRDALALLPPGRAFVTSTDAPFLSPEWVQALADYPGTVAPLHDGYVQPLCAIYETRLASAASDLIEQKRMRPLFLLEAGDFTEVPSSRLPYGRVFENLNTPEAYLRAVYEDNENPPPVRIEFFGMARTETGLDSLELKPATLASIQAELASRWPTFKSLEGYLLSLNGEDFVDTSTIPVGPGETVVVLDRAVGG